MRVGTQVIVHISFTGGWSAGFEVAEAERSEGGETKYRLRRRSDGSILPSWFPEDDVRPALLSEQPNQVFLEWRETEKWVH